MIRKKYASVQLSSWLVCVYAFVGFTSLASSAPPRSKADTKTVIFAVEDHPADQVAIKDQIIDPIVIIDRGRYLKLPSPTGGDVEQYGPETSAFFSTYYQPGKQYRLLFGGSDAGTVTVNKRENFNCLNLTATVKLETSVKLGGDVKALATNSRALGHQKNSRRQPIASEQEAISKLAREIYQEKGVRASLLSQMQVVNLTATDINGDGSAELIGNFRMPDIRGDEEDRALFLIAEIQDGRYRPGLVLYHAFRGEGFAEDILVDQLDLDGDGLAEIIIKSVGYFGYEYEIYKKQKNRWQMIYKGGGGGCG